MNQLRNFITVTAFFFITSTAQIVSAETPKGYSGAELEGQKLNQELQFFNKTINSGDLQNINNLYNQFTNQLKATEVKIGQVSGASNRNKLNEKYVRPAKIAVERTIYEISQLRLLKSIERSINQKQLVIAESDTAKLGRLINRAEEIKEIGGYVSLPKTINMSLRENEALVQGALLNERLTEYNSVISKANLEQLNDLYDNFTKQVRITEQKIGQVAGSQKRRNFNNSYVGPAKIAKERTIYEISQFRLMSRIESDIQKTTSEKFTSDLAVLNRLVNRSKEIKRDGNYQQLPEEITATLEGKRYYLTYLYQDATNTLDPNNPEHMFPRLAELKMKWNALSEASKRDMIMKDAWTLQSETKYPGYLPKHLGFLYHLTGDSQYKEMTKETVALLNKYYLKNGRLKSPEYQKTGWWYRDPFARDLNGLYEAYKYTQLPEIIDFIDNQAALWMSQVPRQSNNGFTIYPYGISDGGKIGSAEINPNQNIQVATLFSNLYWEPESKFYKNPTLKDIVYNEVNAVLSLQKENGSLPLRENLPLVEDTNYGGYTGNMLYQLAQIWGNPAWIESTIELGNWLFHEYSMNHPWNTPEDAPNYHFDRMNSFNLISRVLLFYAAGIPEQYVKNWIRFSEDRFPEEELYLLERWYFYKSVPRDYLNNDISIMNQLPPRIYSDASSDLTSVRIVGETISSANVTVTNSLTNETVATFNVSGDNQKSFPLPIGEYVINIEATEANGKTTTDSQKLSLSQEQTYSINVVLFDQHNRFYQKIK
ncbi:carboxypeptidase regulatory-like domain-containing protein [Bacillus sp. AFS040349]|uniref:carboxypeptidase regulatory-like domain-containing protein n=1 Tax=Bacillus sp. AFS040349 TaxID=2033502 RepID=UPI000BFD5646|nr:carboxypeptidase regulatory-like domain-containing protein [Bacillus sp. AFS040349]PGT80866.1 hypothetical protein COD11_19500 [Bacillus sp. AFS040349]